MPNPAHFILVDFQNVTKVDLDRLAVPDVVLLLFLGENQKKLATSLEKQVIQHPAEVRLIKVRESTPNALDKRLAEYLGGLCSRHPAAQFHILSKDKDYDLVVACLVGTGLKVARYNAFEELPIITPKKSGASRAPFVMPTQTALAEVTPTQPPAQPKSNPQEAKMEKLIKHLRETHPPVSDGLKNAIKHHFQPTVPKGGIKGVIAELKKRGILAVDNTGKVTYF
jgi:hypothetical protein